MHSWSGETVAEVEKLVGVLGGEMLLRSQKDFPQREIERDIVERLFLMDLDGSRRGSSSWQETEVVDSELAFAISAKSPERKAEL